MSAHNSQYDEKAHERSSAAEIRCLRFIRYTSLNHENNHVRHGMLYVRILRNSHGRGLLTDTPHWRSCRSRQYLKFRYG